MLLQEELLNKVIVSFRYKASGNRSKREYLGTDKLLRYLESYEDVFSPLIYKNKAGESYTLSSSQKPVKLKRTTLTAKTTSDRKRNTLIVIA